MLPVVGEPHPTVVAAMGDAIVAAVAIRQKGGGACLHFGLGLDAPFLRLGPTIAVVQGAVSANAKGGDL
jgi:hypothetical protein